MKYLLRWSERSYGSAAAYEEAQERILGIMQHWQPPADVTFHQFLVRVGSYGGYAVVETENPASLHQLTSVFAVFDFVVEPVLDVGEALGAEGAAVAWRHSIA